MSSTPSESGLISSYAGLLFLATTIIYAGAWSSLPNPPKGSSKENNEADDEDDEDIVDRLTSGDAYLFPVIGSVVLGGLYLLIKYFDREWINWILSVYFAFAGVGSVWNTSTSILRSVVGDSKWRTFDKVNFLVLKRNRELFSLSLRTPAIWLLVPSLVPSVLFVTSFLNPRPALITNILGVSFAHTALSVFKLDTFRTGCILLAGLFLYDIWWVFGTKVMVSVATGLDIPIKLAWPKSVDFSSRAGFTILGLGDIVIPGAFVTLSLRYDLYCSTHRDWRKPFKKPYFTGTMTAYMIGLAMTMIVMHNFKAAQPALLYLSPACIISFFATGLSIGDLHMALSWQDEPPTPSLDIEADTLKEIKPEQSDPSYIVNSDGVMTEQSHVTSSIQSTDDFVSIEKENDEKYTIEDDSNIKRRKGKKKKY